MLQGSFLRLSWYVCQEFLPIGQSVNAKPSFAWSNSQKTIYSCDEITDGFCTTLICLLILGLFFVNFWLNSTNTVPQIPHSPDMVPYELFQFRFIFLFPWNRLKLGPLVNVMYGLQRYFFYVSTLGKANKEVLRVKIVFKFNNVPLSRHF